MNEQSDPIQGPRDESSASAQPPRPLRPPHRPTGVDPKLFQNVLQSIMTLDTLTDLESRRIGGYFETLNTSTRTATIILDDGKRLLAGLASGMEVAAFPIGQRVNLQLLVPESFNLREYCAKGATSLMIVEITSAIIEATDQSRPLLKLATPVCYGPIISHTRDLFECYGTCEHITDAYHPMSERHECPVFPPQCDRCGLQYGSTIHAAACSAGAELAPPQQLSDPGIYANDPFLASTRTGHAAVIWQQGFLCLAEWLPEKGWSDPHPLPEPSRQVRRLQLAMNESGDALAVWVTYESRHDVIRSSIRPSAGSWTSSTEVGRSDVSSNIYELHGMLATHGTASIVWKSFGLNTTECPPHGAWTEARNIARDVSTPHFASNQAGDILAVWVHLEYNESTQRHDQLIRVAQREREGKWQANQVISPAGQQGNLPRAAVNDVGDALVIWRDGKDSVCVRERTASDKWRPVETLFKKWNDDFGIRVDEPDAAVDSHGNAIAIWTVDARSQGSDVTVFFAERAQGEAWSSPRKLWQSSNGIDNAHVALDEDGNAVAVWTAENENGWTVRMAMRTEPQSWTEAQVVSEPADYVSNLQVRFGPAGTAIMIWTQSRNIRDFGWH